VNPLFRSHVTWASAILNNLQPQVAATEEAVKPEQLEQRTMIKQLAGIFIGCLTLAAGQSIHAEGLPGKFETVAPESLDWVLIQDGLGAEYAVVHGDPGKAGTYVIRVRFPAGVMDLPHSHTVDRHVTVLAGTWHAGTGPSFDPASAVPLGTGSYMFHPAGGIHWDGAGGDEDAVVQIIGNGPVETRQEHPGGVDWVRVKQSISAPAE